MKTHLHMVAKSKNKVGDGEFISLVRRIRT